MKSVVVSHGQVKPDRENAPRIREVAATAALARLERETEKKKEIKAKNERAKQEAEREEEEKILAMKRAAAAAGEALERSQAIKSAQAKEAARLAAEERSALAVRTVTKVSEHQGVDTASFPVHNNMEEKIINVSVGNSIHKNPESVSSSSDKAKEREARARSQKAREAARKAEEEVLEAKKRAAAEAGKELERVEQIMSAKARKAARLAAEERLTKASQKPQNHSFSPALVAVQDKTPKKETVNVTDEEHDLKGSSKDSITYERLGMDEINGNGSKEMATLVPVILKSAGLEKEIVNVGGTQTLLDSDEEEIRHSERSTSTVHSYEERLISHADVKNRQTMMSYCMEDYHIRQRGARPKERTIKHSKHANNIQASQEYSVYEATSTEPEVRSSFMYGLEKEFVSVMAYEEKNKESRSTVTADVERRNKESVPTAKEMVSVNTVDKSRKDESESARNEDQPSQYVELSNLPETEDSHSPENKPEDRQGSQHDIRMSNESKSAENFSKLSQYVELGKPPEMDDTHMAGIKLKESQGLQSKSNPGEGMAEGQPESHQQHETLAQTSQQRGTPSPEMNRGQEHPHHHHHHHHHHYPGNEKQQPHRKSNHHWQPQQHRTPPGHTSRMMCGSCNKKFNLKEKLPRYLHCGHTICTLCICERTNLDHTISCPYCPKETFYVREATCRPTNDSIIRLLSQETEDANDKIKACSHPSSNRQQSFPKHGNDSTQSGIMLSESQSGGVKQNTSPLRSPHDSKCLEMGVRPSLYCSSCLVWVCTQCAEAEHAVKKCSLKPLKEQLSDMKQMYDLTSQKTQELLKKCVETLEDDCEQENVFQLWMRLAFDSRKKRQENMIKALQTGKEMIDTLNDVIQEVPSARNLPEALTRFQILEDLASEAYHWSLSGALCSAGDGKETTAFLGLLMKSTLKHLCIENGKSELYATEKIPGGELFSEVRYDEGWFHLHALRKGRPTKPEAKALPLQCFKSTQDMASTLVFLDLSWGGRCQGRLYVRLTGDTLRGRQFIGLCAGEGGISFCGTRFHRVWWKGLPGEHVWTGDCENGDGSGGRMHPLPSRQLQVPVGQEVPITPGLVAGRYEKNLSTIFRIYTQGDRESRDEEGFGQVELGLEVVMEAIQLRNISEVVISDCGLVLEM